jgi:voltage-gated potassium channel
MLMRSSIAYFFIRLMAVARVRFFIHLSLLFLGVWLACAGLIWVLEGGVNSKLTDLPKTIYVLLVTMTTSGDSAAPPVTPGGRWVMGFALMASKLLTALLCALAAAVLIDRKVREEMGLIAHDLEKHVVILGWNLKGPHIVSTLRGAAETSGVPIVVLAHIESKPVDDPLVYFTRCTNPVRGDAIQRACLGTASTVVVLADYAERSHADALTAINVMVARKAAPSARIIAELLDPSQRIYLDTAGADQVVGIGEVGGFLLAEAVIGTEDAQNLLAVVSQGVNHRRAQA